MRDLKQWLGYLSEIVGGNMGIKGILEGSDQKESDRESFDYIR